MAGLKGDQQQLHYLTKVITTANTGMESVGAENRMLGTGKGEDLSSINSLLQQIRTQASQGNSQQPNQ